MTVEQIVAAIPRYSRYLGAIGRRLRALNIAIDKAFRKMAIDDHREFAFTDFMR
jgi:hypothetical protein